MRLLLPSLSAAALAGPALAQGVILSDDFETNTAADYTLVDDGSPDGSQTFAFDYVAAGIQLAASSGASGGGGASSGASSERGEGRAPWTGRTRSSGGARRAPAGRGT